MKKKLIENIVSLFTLKGAEYIVQFITLPYLLRVLGPGLYGSIAFAQTIINYAMLVVDYGFNMTAPRDIAKANEDELGRHFVAIYCAKIILLVGSLIIGSVAVLFFHIENLLLLCLLPSLFGNVLFPIWFFQGIQQMRFITIFNLIARSLSVGCIFLFVRNSDDFYLAALFQSMVPVVAGGISLFVLYRKYPKVFIMPKLADIREKIINGWDIFVSTLFINLYTNSNVFLLGILTNNTVVGYYTAANKLIEAVKGLMAPISNAVFPHVSVLFKESKTKAVDFLCRILHFIAGITLITSSFVFVMAEQLVTIIMGDSYNESILILKIISFLPFIIGLSNIFGIQTMVAFGMQRIFSRILMASAFLNFILVCPMIYIWQGIGLAITVVIVESFVTITMYVVLRKNNIIIQ